MHGTVRAMRTSVVESEHVLAQSNVWEMRSEKQMAALRMGVGRKGGGTSDDEPTYKIYHLCCQNIHQFHSFIHPPKDKTEQGGVRSGNAS